MSTRSSSGPCRVEVFVFCGRHSSRSLGPQKRLHRRRCVFCGRHSSRYALGPQRPFAVARPLSPALRAGDKPLLVSWSGFVDLRRGSRCAASPLLGLWPRPDPHGRCIRERVCFATPPLLTAFGRTPAANAATPGGGLLSSAFLASGVRVRGEGGPEQQKANPNVDSSSVKDPLRGSRRPDAGVRPNAVRRGTVAPHKSTGGRRFAPYLRAKRAQWGAENASFTRESTARFQINPRTSRPQTHFRGADRARSARRRTLAKQKPLLVRPLRGEQSEDGRSHNKSRHVSSGKESPDRTRRTVGRDRR